MKLPKNTLMVRWFFAAVLLLLIAGLTGTVAQTRRNRAAKEFMREKLELSQRLLEGITMEDYDLVIAKGTKLSTMVEAADWRVFENPDYELHSKNFKRQVDALVQAAKKKNLDSATFAYVRMTMSCIDCHKFVKGKIVASLR